MASAHLSRTFTSGNRKTFTISVWFKLGNPSIGSSDFENIIAASGGDHGIWIRGDKNELDLYFSTNLVGTTSIRDVNAWYHLVVGVDTTQSTASNRVKVYLNGEQFTSLDDGSGGSVSYPSLNADTLFNNNGGTCTIGKRGSTDAHYWTGSMSHFHYVDGTAYQASTFGETDTTTGIWKPKTAPTVTYGTNGFFLKFDNSGNMGLDSSGNSNNLTTSGTIIQNKDTPSNVFATLNPLDRIQSNATFANCNSQWTTTSGYYWSRSTLGVSSGKYYFEAKLSSSPTHGHIGIVDEAPDSSTDSGFEDDAYNWGYKTSNGNVYNNGSNVSYGDTYTTGDIVAVALDLDNNKLYFSKNGTWQNSGDPTSGTTGTGAISITDPSSTNTGNYFFAVGDNASATNGTWQTNFGNGYFGTTAVTSAQNPDDGIGIFEYDVPAGYRALCTKSINAQEYS